MLIFLGGASLFFDGFMLARQPDAWPFWIACAAFNLAGITYLGWKR